MNPTRYVEVDEARAARGLRLVVAGGIPSPWSEAAKGIFRLKGIPFVCVRLMAPGKEVRAWTRMRNAPAAMFDDEPARSGWSDIVELAERLAPSPSLVPELAEERVKMFGLCHEVMGEGGIGWSSRLLSIHHGLETDGTRGFAPMIATYLAARYGYVKDAIDVAHRRVAEGWALLDAQLADQPYFFGERPTVLDVHVAATVNIFEVPPEESCAMLPLVRAAFESMRGTIPHPPPRIIAHRDRMYARHLELPIAL